MGWGLWWDHGGCGCRAAGVLGELEGPAVSGNGGEWKWRAVRSNGRSRRRELWRCGGVLLASAGQSHWEAGHMQAHTCTALKFSGRLHPDLSVRVVSCIPSVQCSVGTGVQEAWLLPYTVLMLIDVVYGLPAVHITHDPVTARCPQTMPPAALSPARSVRFEKGCHFTCAGG